MLKKLVSPIYLLPLALVTPYIFIGPYGVTLAEVLILLVFFVFALPALSKDSFRLPRFLLIYLALYFAGWLGGVINGSGWGMPVGLANLNFFYRIVLTIGGYYIGYRLYQSMDTIIEHRFFHIVIIGLAIVAMSYPFLTYEQRYAMLKMFYAGGDSEIHRLYSPRFPGLGINANVYSFMVFIFLLFSFDAYLRKLVSAIFPLLAFCIIVTASSKLVISLSIASCLFVVCKRTISIESLRKGYILHIGIRKRGFSVILLLLLMGMGSALYLTQTSFGTEIVESVQAFDRFQEVIEGKEGVSGFNARFSLWNLGLKRVALAPIFGIVRHRYIVSDTDVLFFSTPHNEFIELWMFYGVAGVFAHIFLLGTLMKRNLCLKAELPWFLLYPALVIQMLFDAAFSGVRFHALFFMIVGINIHYLNQRRLSHTGYQIGARKQYANN